MLSTCGTLRPAPRASVVSKGSTRSRKRTPAPSRGRSPGKETRVHVCLCQPQAVSATAQGPGPPSGPPLPKPDPRNRTACGDRGRTRSADGHEPGRGDASRGAAPQGHPTRNGAAPDTLGHQGHRRRQDRERGHRGAGSRHPPLECRPEGAEPEGCRADAAVLRDAPDLGPAALPGAHAGGTHARRRDPRLEVPAAPRPDPLRDRSGLDPVCPRGVCLRVQRGHASLYRHGRTMPRPCV